MKKFAFGFACVLAGCAVGATMPTITAQTFAPDPSAPKWDQFCELQPGHLNATNLEAAQSGSEFVAAKGREGWELASTFGDGPRYVFCFKRPAPH